jgi:hypothetical protein
MRDEVRDAMITYHRDRLQLIDLIDEMLALGASINQMLSIIRRSSEDAIKRYEEESNDGQ